MNKYQVIWLIIRLVGVYFAYLTLVSFLGLVGAVPGLFTLPKIDTNTKNANVANSPNSPNQMPNSPNMPNQPIRVQPISPNGNYNAPPENPDTNAKSGESITDKFKGENVKNFAWFLLFTAIYGAAAWYLLRDGRLLYEILNREKPQESGKEKEAEVTTLNLSDKQN